MMEDLDDVVGDGVWALVLSSLDLGTCSGMFGIRIMWSYIRRKWRRRGGSMRRPTTVARCWRENHRLRGWMDRILKILLLFGAVVVVAVHWVGTMLW